MVMEGTIDERIYALWSEKGDSAQLALDGRLTEDQVEQADLAALMTSAVQNFDPQSPKRNLIRPPRSTRLVEG